jgi:colanic acid/amylovoran biosynthesis glycosyltransferase
MDPSFIAYVVQQFPALRTTFIRREVEELGRLGVPLRVISIRRPPAGIERLEPEAESHLRSTTYLPQRPVDIGSVLENARWAMASPQATARNVLMSLGEPGTLSWGGRARMWLQLWRAASLAQAIRSLGTCRWVHAQFADGAATTSLAAARLLEVPFSFTSHTSFDSALLRQKVRDATLVASISRYDRRRLSDIAGDELLEKIHVVHCGVPIANWMFAPKPDRGATTRIAAVGALDEKKGHDVLVDAAALLRDEGLRFECVIVGGGPLEPSLRSRIASLGLGDRVTLAGPCPQKDVRRTIEECDLFVLACKRASNGDTDGVPVSLMEPMALGRPVVSTTIAGVPDLIEHGVTGLLAIPGDARSLASRIREALEMEPAARLAMLEAARRHVEREFDARREAAKMASLLGYPMERPA